MLPLLFSRRYLFSKKSHSVINIISGVSVFAVAMPVAAMIILLSVFNGFERLVHESCSAFDAELTVTPREGSTFAIAETDTAALARIPEVAGLSFILEQSALLQHDGRQAIVTVRGVDDAYDEVLGWSSAVTNGEAAVRIGDLERMVIGQTMAGMLGIRSLADADVDAYAVRRGRVPSLLPSANYTRHTVPVGGIFVLDMDSEQNYVLVSLRLARELFHYPDRASALLLRLADGTTPERMKAVVAQAVGNRFDVRTRHEMRASFYRIMTYEKWGIFFISLLVLVIASFSMVGALSMLIIEKRKDVRTLRALGADTRLIRRIFIGEGVLIGSIGAAIGTVTGVTVTLVQQLFGIVEIPVESLVTRSYPVLFQVNDLLAVLGAFALVVAAVTGLTVYNMIPKNNRQP